MFIHRFMHYEAYLKQTNFDIWQTYWINLNTLLNLCNLKTLKTYMQLKYILTYALRIFLFISTLKINDTAKILTLQTHCKPSWFFHSRSRDTLNDGTWKILFYFERIERNHLCACHKKALATHLCSSRLSLSCWGWSQFYSCPHFPERPLERQWEARSVRRWAALSVLMARFLQASVRAPLGGERVLSALQLRKENMAAITVSEGQCNGAAKCSSSTFGFCD